jgi:hypothetical protein
LQDFEAVGRQRGEEGEERRREDRRSGDGETR